MLLAHHISQSNGQAEYAVQTLKKLLEDANDPYIVVIVLPEHCTGLIVRGAWPRGNSEPGKAKTSRPCPKYNKSHTITGLMYDPTQPSSGNTNQL